VPLKSRLAARKPQRDYRPLQVFTRYNKPEWEPPVRVALFITCYNDTLFPQTGIATVRLLERLGHTVEFPEDQTCCGQMHSNTGYGDEAIPLIRRFVKAFRDAEVIVSPSSCVSNIRTAYLRSLADTDDEALKLDVIELVPRVFELSQFLVNKLGIEDVGAYFRLFQVLCDQPEVGISFGKQPGKGPVSTRRGMTI
jgi:Fe-S oxidoreductase